jgi:hypothetical protein
MFDPQSRQNSPATKAPPELNGEALTDFVLQKGRGGGWEMSVVTQRAFHWISANHAERFDVGSGFTAMTLNEANALLREIRKAGLHTRYEGPNRAEML